MGFMLITTFLNTVLQTNTVNLAHCDAVCLILRPLMDKNLHLMKQNCLNLLEIQT